MLGRIWWVAASLLALGCSKKTENAAKPEPLPSSSAATALPTPEKPPEPPPPALAYKLIKKFAAHASFFELTNGVIMCENCVIGDRPIDTRPLFSFDGTDLKELTGLLTDKRVSGNLGESITSAMKVVKGGSYSFAGTLPKSLILRAYGDWDDDNIERNGKAEVERFLKYDGTRWSVCGSDEWYKLQQNQQAEGGRWDRALDDAMLHAPRLGYGFNVVSAGKGPLLVVADNFLDRWDGKQWQTTEPTWGQVRAVHRLEDGRTLVQTSSHLEVIDVKGEASRLALPDDASPNDLRLLFIQDRPWLISSSALWVPSETNVVRARLPKPEARAKAPVVVAAATVAVPVTPPPDAPPVASAAPAGSVNAASAVAVASVAPVASAQPADTAATPSAIAPPSASAASPIEGIPAMTGFSASCKTPFVVLFTPPSPNWRYDEAAQNLREAKDLQDKLWFFEFTRNKITYFGAQAEDEASARALMAAYQAKVPKSKPILGCLDAKAYLPDRYEDKIDARTLLINLRAGAVL